MKKLLKNVICRIREQYTGALFTVEKSNVVVETKCEKINADAAFSTIQMGPLSLLAFHDLLHIASFSC